MNNEFKKMYQNLEPPAELKKDIMDELYSYQMLSDIVELFTGDFVRTGLNMLNIPEAAQKKDDKKR